MNIFDLASKKGLKVEKKDDNNWEISKNWQTQKIKGSKEDVRKLLENYKDE